jgi:hypothetical protein
MWACANPPFSGWLTMVRPNVHDEALFIAIQRFEVRRFLMFEVWFDATAVVGDLDGRLQRLLKVQGCDLARPSWMLPPPRPVPGVFAAEPILRAIHHRVMDHRSAPYRNKTASYFAGSQVML